ncbi:MAG: SPFH domain-containing protein, partial [Bacteroidales bacterium]|nr:SPFH domain-containing protein [Bacteroidales bacterium]
MENKEFEFKGLRVNGFLMLFVVLAIIAVSIYGFTTCTDGEPLGLILGGIAMILIDCILCIGFIKIEPNEAMVMVFFGKYQGTLTKVGFHWANPFYSSKKVSLRARNLNVDPIKVNDKTGNPIMIGQILVWKLKDTYKAMFEIDSQTLAAAGS